MTMAQSSINQHNVGIHLLTAKVRGNTVTISKIDSKTLRIDYNDEYHIISDIQEPDSYQYVVRGKAPIFFATRATTKLRQYGWGPLFSYLSNTYRFVLDNEVMRCYKGSEEIANINLLDDTATILSSNIATSFPEWLLLIRTKIK